MYSVTSLIQMLLLIVSLRKKLGGIDAAAFSKLLRMLELLQP